MKIAIIYNEDVTGVLNTFGMQNKEKYNPKTVRLVADALEKGDHNVRVIDGNMAVIEKLQEFMPRVIDGERMGMVFNMAYGIQGESRYTHLPAMMEMLGIPYVGSGPSGHALALDKVITKIILQKNNLPTPDFWVFSSEEEDMTDVRFPVIVKPKMEAVSFGLRVVHTIPELKEAVTFIVSEFKQQALVEQFVRGREFCVGMLGNGDLEMFPVLEIDLEDDPDAIQSVDDKRKKPRGKICPAEISDALADRMKQVSRAAFNALELKDFARVDLRMDEQDNIFILEINSMASLGRTGSYVYSAGIAGYDFPALVNRIVDVAAIRYFSDSFLPEERTYGTKGKGKKLPVSTRIRGVLRSRIQHTEKLLRDMVNTNSQARNVDGVNWLGALIWQELSAMGFSQQVIPQVDVGNILLFSNGPADQFDVLFLGNLDSSVPFSRQENYREKGQKLSGSAIWKNKGGIAVMISALQALRYIKHLKKVKIGILLTTDETLYGRFSRPYIEQFSAKAKTVLGLNGGGADATVVTSRAGSAVYTCQMNMVAAEKAEDVAMAVSRFSQLTARTANLTNEQEGIVAAPYKVEIKSDVTGLSASGEMAVNLRFSQPEQADHIDRKLRDLVKKENKGHLKIQVEGSVRRRPLACTPLVADLRDTLFDIAKKIDVRVVEEHRWTSSNVCFVNQDKPVIDGLGAVGGMAGERREYIYRHSLLDRAALLAMLIYQIKD